MVEDFSSTQNYDSPLLIPFVDEDGDFSTVLLPTVSRAAAQFFTTDLTNPDGSFTQANYNDPMRSAIIANLAQMFLVKNLVGFGEESAKETGYPGEGGSWRLPVDSGTPA